MELNIGSNMYRGANGIIKLDGREQVVIEIRPDPQLLLTTDLYDAGGSQLAHLRRNTWAFNSKNRFEVQTSATLALFSYPLWYKIVDKQTGTTILDIHLVREDTVHVLSGALYSHKGQLFEITPHYWRFAENPKLFGNVQDVRGGPVVINSDSAVVKK